MSKVNQIEIICTECTNQFPSPISFSNMDTFDTSTLIGNKVKCPNCNNMVECNKENMKIRSDDGGYIGKDT